MGYRQPSYQTFHSSPKEWNGEKQNWFAEAEPVKAVCMTHILLILKPTRKGSECCSGHAPISFPFVSGVAEIGLKMGHTPAVLAQTLQGFQQCPSLVLSSAARRGGNCNGERKSRGAPGSVLQP